MKYRKIILILIGIALYGLTQYVDAKGISFGVPSAVRKKTKQLKEKIIESGIVIIGVDGGIIEESNNYKVEIPAGALSEEARIKVEVPSLTNLPEFSKVPDNIRNIAKIIHIDSSVTEFNKPIKITIYYDETILSDNGILTAIEEEELLVAYTFNEDLSDYEILNIARVDTTNNFVEIEVTHFSWIGITWTKPLYMKIDIPPQNGDIVFRMTPNKWIPGHAGIYFCEDSNEYVIEAMPPKVRKISFADFKSNNIYMGSRNSKQITSQSRDEIVQLANNLIGENYVSTGYITKYGFYELAIPIASASLSKGGNGEYTCVGLTEYCYESTGLDLVDNNIGENPYFFPVEQYYATQPSNEVTVNVSETVNIPITFIHGSNVSSINLTVKETDIPATEYTLSENSFSWTPKAEQAGQDWNVTFEATYTLEVAYIPFDRIINQSVVISVNNVDTTAPTIANVSAGSLTTSGATINWNTNESATSQVQYGLTTSYGTTYPTSDSTADKTSHSVSITSLSADKLYHYRVISKDSSGNSATGSDGTFTTSAVADTTAPTISNVAESSLTSSGVAITWTTDESATSQVEYGLTTSYGTTYPTSDSSADKISHSVALSGLSAETLYHYRVISKDSSNNTATSSDGTFITNTTSTTTSRELPDTGQTTSYTATYGEDHDYQSPATQMSYTDNGDGTVTDNLTGLMWLQEGNYPFNGSSSTGTWEQALTFCEDFFYAGYSDWRLPNVKDLASILLLELKPSINATYFLNTAGIYWTSTTSPTTTPYAMAVLFNSGSRGTVFRYSKTTNTFICVRPVRGGQ